MKIFKEELKIWKQHSDNRTVEALPPHLDIELTNRCNLFCDQCPYHGKNKIFEQTPWDMNFEMFKKIINEACTKNVRSVKLSFSGEPLLYPRIIEAIKYAKCRGLKVNINSNGILLDKDTSIKLMKSQLDVLILSDYNLDAQLKGIAILQAQKQTFRINHPYILMKTNNPQKYKELVDEIIPLEYYDYTQLEESFKRYSFYCGFPWQRLLILADGSVLSCACGMGLIELKQSYLGNMKYNNTLESLWNSHKMNFLRVIHENNESHLLKMCRMCPKRKGGG